MERITCFICGRNFSVIIIHKHEDVCFSHWRKNNLQLPILYQKAIPERPKGVNFCSRESDSHYNNAAKASSLKCRLPQFVPNPSVRISVASNARVNKNSKNSSDSLEVPHMNGHRSQLFPRIHSSKTQTTPVPVALSKSPSRNEKFINTFEVSYRAQGWTSDLIRDPCGYPRTPTDFHDADEYYMNPNRFIEIPILDKRNFPVDKTRFKKDQNYDVFARISFPWEKNRTLNISSNLSNRQKCYSITYINLKYFETLFGLIKVEFDYFFHINS